MQQASQARFYDMLVAGRGGALCCSRVRMKEGSPCLQARKSLQTRPEVQQGALDLACLQLCSFADLAVSVPLLVPVGFCFLLSTASCRLSTGANPMGSVLSSLCLLDMLSNLAASRSATLIHHESPHCQTVCSRPLGEEIPEHLYLRTVQGSCLTESCGWGPFPSPGL